MASRLFSAFALFVIASFSVNGQPINVVPDFSLRGYDGCSADRLCHYQPTNSFESAYKEFAAWRGQSANNPTDFMNFRVAFPAGYNPNRAEKYPVILMLHGAGESGRIWSGQFDYAPSNPLYDNNSRNLLHGGNVHQQAANRNPTHPQAFPGIIIFPQASYSGSWASGWQEEPTTNQEYLYQFLEWMVVNRNADINRIYIHGLSNGGRGTWDTATKRPDLFAAALPMSGLPYNSDVSAARLETTPIRLYQGGTDGNPSPGGAVSMINKLVANGGNPQYILYPTLGHGVWNQAYSEPDFWSWMLSKSKLNIYIFGGSTELCPGATKKLGFSYGYTSYQWKKDGVAMPGETTRYLTITGDAQGNYIGSYSVDFTRPNGSTGTSNPVMITGEGAPITPVLSVTGSLVLPYTRDDNSNIGSVGQTATRLVAPQGYSQYRWIKNGALPGIINATNVVQITSGHSPTGVGDNFNGQSNSNNVGVWSVQVLQPSGCWSNSSNGKTLVFDTNHPLPEGGSVNENGSQDTPLRYLATLGKPQLQAQSATQMLVTWTETVSDEEFFEVWRQTGSSGADWNMVGIVPANSTQFLDNGLTPDTGYAYSIRAMVSTSGRFSRKSATSTGNFTKTLPDNQAPTPPANLVVTEVTETSISISWSASIDNHLVTGYEVYTNATPIAPIVAAPSTTYTFTGLDPGTTYMLNVRARDFTGNYSTFPQAVVATTNGSTNGLSYKYYATTGLSGVNGTTAPTIPYQLAEPYVTTNGPNFNFSTAVPNQIGITGNFNNGVAIAMAAQNGTNDPNNFVLAFDGFIQIDVAGNYRFYTSSDDGSRLYINGNLLINNDGAQGTTTVSGVVNLGVGKHAIRVTYFENGGGNVFVVRYNGPSAGSPTDNFNTAIAIPDNKLFLTNTTITNYYSKNSGDLASTTSWGINADGSGATPPNFTTNYQVFNIANRASATLSNAWTVSGTSSRIVVGNNITLNLDAPLTAKVYANAGSTINLNHTTLPQLTQLHSTSTVNMNVSGSVPLAVYGNLNLATGATTKTLPISSTLVNGNLQVNDQVILNGSTAPAPGRSTLVVAGNVTFLGNSSAPPALANRYSLIFDGNNAHTLSVNQTDISLAALEVEGTLNMNFNDASAHTLTVGMVNGSGGLLLRSGSTLNLGNHNLVVNGVYGVNPTDDSGEININGGNITVATASGQTSSIYFSDEVDTHNVQNLSLSNTGAGQINIVGQTKLTNLMTVGTGTKVNMQGDFVLRSTSDAGNGTARIGPLLNGARIAGNITAERYMSGEGRIWRYISSPVKNATVAQLQQSFPITGNFTGASVINANSLPSMYQYTEPNYVQFPSVGGSNQEVLQTGRGYSPFIREETAPTNWKLTGEPNQGDIAFPLTPNAGNNPNLGWNLVGNPYPAPIQWTGNFASNGNWPGSGINAAAGVRVNSNGNSTVLTFGVNWDGVVAPGQAFWVRTTSASPTLTVKESAKLTADGAFYRIGDDENKVRVTLRSATLQDVAAIRFDVAATAAYDSEIDGIKLDNSFFNISTLTADNKPVALNNTTINYCEQEVKLRITNAAVGTYSLDVTGVSSLISKDEVTFTDNFTQTQLTVTDALTYAFSITADAASKADGRFTLRFKKPEVVLNQTLKTEAACEQSSPIVLVNNSQPGVSYQAFHNGIAVSDVFMSTGGSLQVLVNPALVGIGATEVNMKAGFTGCNSYDLPMTISVQRDSLPLPLIIAEPTKLVASTENATYQWYQNGILVPEQTGKEWLNPENGKYVVAVFKGTCLKVSDTLEYVVTSVEKPNRLYQLYPNPTRDKFIITLEEPIDFASMRVITSMGQVLQMPVVKISEYSAEVDLAEVKTGFYLLQVNGQRYKVLKE